MTDQTRATYEDASALLADWSTRLASDHLPVDILAIAVSLGVEVRIESSEVAPHHGSLRDDAGRWSVIVYQPPDQRAGLTERQRFTVAHELGHYLVESELRLRPTRRRDYWRLETLCHRFANQILVPRHVIRLREGAATRQTLNEIWRLSHEARVSKIAAAHAVVDIVPPLAVVEVTEVTTAAVPRVAEVSNLIDDQRYFGVGPRQHIHPSDPLGPIVAEHATTAMGETREHHDTVYGGDVTSRRSGPRRIIITATRPSSSQRSGSGKQP